MTTTSDIGTLIVSTADDQMQVPYLIPRECIIKISEDTGL